MSILAAIANDLTHDNTELRAKLTEAEAKIARLEGQVAAAEKAMQGAIDFIVALKDQRARLVLEAALAGSSGDAGKEVKPAAGEER